MITQVVMTRRHDWPFFPDLDRPRRVPIRRTPGAPHHTHSPDREVHREVHPDVRERVPGHEPGPAASPARVAELEAEVERLRALVEEKDQHARESAVRARMAGEELERARERIRKDADRELEQRKRSILLAFVEVVDDLDRALDATRHDASNPMVEGMELVRKQFANRLGQFGVTRFTSLGEPFDPARHEALSTIPVTEPDKHNTVVGVVREGYLIGDEVLRPAAVAVGKLVG